MILKVFTAILFSLHSIQVQKLLITKKYSKCPGCNQNECLEDYVCNYGMNMKTNNCCKFCEAIGIRTNITDFLERFRNDQIFRNIFKCGQYVPGFLENLFGEWLVKMYFDSYGEDCRESGIPDYPDDFSRLKMQKQRKNIFRRFVEK
ncbi:unnamed protein product [Gordionus sp. m RMFG-2023]